MRKISKIYIHCSASKWADVKVIRQWHTKDRGWRDVGYHFVICNGYPTYSTYKKGLFQKEFDGKIQEGRPLSQIGCHVRGDNRNSIGICLIGNEHFTPTQFLSLASLVAKLLKQFDIKIKNVLGHRDFWTLKAKKPKKTCPNFSMVEFRWFYKNRRRLQNLFGWEV